MLLLADGVGEAKIDEFDVFPVDLSGAEDAMPSGWWSRMSNREEPTQTGPMNGDLAAAN